MLQLDHASLRRGTRLLFSGVTAQIHPGYKVGVTGANGSGKTSLFSLIQGELQTDGGECRVPPDWVIGHVAQEMPTDSRAAIDHVLDGDAELRDLQALVQTAERTGDGGRLGRLHADLERIDGYSARHRAARILHGLGFADQQLDTPLSSFSGGWRMRLQLGRALMCRSDLLLLDEPTNHLDLDAVIWLEQWLHAYPGTLLLISHDRDFLDRVVEHVLHLAQQDATLYRGNYSAFELQRAEQLANQQAQYTRQQREIKHIRSYVDRFRAQATKARQAQSRLKALERMEFIAPAHVDSPFTFSILPPEKTPSALLQLDACDVGYGEQAVLTGVGLGLAPGDRIGLLGANGAGKSTFIKLLAGELAPRAGKRETARDLKIGYFAQHQLAQLHPEHTPLEHLAQIDGRAREQSLRDYLGGFGFVNEQALSPVGRFSGGEKSRLVLAMIVYRRPNLLLLDEPTNHLDLEMRQALANALQDFSGAMVLVSHDRHLLRVSCDRLLLIDGGLAQEYDQSLDDYAQWLAGRNNGVPSSAPEKTNGGSVTSAQRKQRKRRQAELRQGLQPLRQTIKDAEAALDSLHKQQQEIMAAMSDHALYDESQKGRLQELLRIKSGVDRALAETEAAWLDANERLERAMTPEEEFSDASVER